MEAAHLSDSPSEPLRRTPLYQSHVDLGAKMVPFAGWEMPVQYAGVIAEHHAVRQQAGLFDVSHMGEIWVSGPEAEKAIQWMTCNNLAVLVNGRAQYNAIINPQGGVVDDIIVYRVGPERFFVCVNASNAERDFKWFCEHGKGFKAVFENVSDSFGQVAIQGPNAIKILPLLGGPFVEAAGLKPFFFSQFSFLGADVVCARTGYTGEDGFEVFISAERTVELWSRLLELGKPHGLVPAGLGARDSLRLEACYPLHGHELGEDITAIESGLGWIVKPEKGAFIGSETLARQKKEGAPRTLVAFEVKDPGIARHGDQLFDGGGSKVGWVTSGTKTPTLNRSVGLAIVASPCSAEGTQLLADVRGRRLQCAVVKKPLYSRK
ncbi:MAG: glycine cleavage system aminomethyltransferase GcvT [Bdellovibrionota bacterium]|nr:MAG: glycine cleavage system aminomethyltransferase GcvT [Bdellovibrionota bacterium]